MILNDKTSFSHATVGENFKGSKKNTIQCAKLSRSGISMTELILNVYFYDAKTLLTSVAGG
jgi:hypothetical protein